MHFPAVKKHKRFLGSRPGERCAIGHTARERIAVAHKVSHCSLGVTLFIGYSNLGTVLVAEIVLLLKLLLQLQLLLLLLL